jgi:fructose-bisphosphate aldolase class I
MVTPGSKNPDKAKVTAEEIATRTCIALSRTVPPALVGVVVRKFFYLFIYLI